MMSSSLLVAVPTASHLLLLVALLALCLCPVSPAPTLYALQSVSAVSSLTHDPFAAADTLATDAAGHLWADAGASLAEYSLRPNGSLALLAQYPVAHAYINYLTIDPAGNAVAVTNSFTPGRVLTFDGRNGSLLSTFNLTGVQSPAGVAVSPLTGAIYVADRGALGLPVGNSTGVTVWAANGTYLASLNGSAAVPFGSDLFYGAASIWGVAVDQVGAVYAANLLGCNIVKYSVDGVYSVLVNLSSIPQLPACMYNSPYDPTPFGPLGLTVDAAGNVWALMFPEDEGQLSLVVGFQPSGALLQVLTVSAVTGSLSPGVGLRALGLAVDPALNVFVSAVADGNGETTLSYSYLLRYSPVPAASTAPPTSAMTASASASTAGPTGTGTSSAGLSNASLCLLMYSLPGSVDYPFSVAYDLRVTYDAASFNLFSVNGTRTYTNRFGASSSTLVGASTPQSLPPLSSGPGAPLSTLTLTPSQNVQLPGVGPLTPAYQLILSNASNTLSEAGVTTGEFIGGLYSSYVLDPLGQAYLSTIPGFVNSTIAASNVNSLAVDYAGCRAPITFVNGLRSPVQPSPENNALHFNFSYTISDGETYSITATLRLEPLSVFATAQDALGNPYLQINIVTGTRVLTNLYPPGVNSTLTSTVMGLQESLYTPPASNRFYPFAYLSAAPGAYSLNTAPFLDGEGLSFYTSDGVVQVSVQYEDGEALLVERSHLPYLKPLLALQRQTYTLG